MKGALGRVIGRVAPQGQKNPQPVKGNHMMRNAGPIKSAVSSADQSLTETGDGLRKVVGRIASRGRVAASKGGKIKKYAEGGKVGSAMSALRMLAKKYRDALDMGDTDQAKRIARQMETMQSGSSKNITEPSSAERGHSDKLATFAKGGKVKAVTDAVKSKREWLSRAKAAIEREFRKSAKMKDDEPVRVRFGKDEKTHVNAKGKRYSFQAGSDDDRYDFRSDDGEHVPVDFTDDMFE
jgi:ribosomal protein S20